jgi:ADP-ribose pyrophosphatase YjhB (NUDIX family)
MIWKPRTTVAAVVEQNDRFLLVEEEINGKMTLNQPAGHLEPDESLIDAVIRETKEETAWTFHPQSLVGIYRWIHPRKGETYIRYCFSGTVTDHDPNQALDDDIYQALWLPFDEIRRRQADLRSTLVTDCFQDYIDGHRYPLDILRN